jgi:hypothetical protein
LWQFLHEKFDAAFFDFFSCCPETTLALMRLRRADSFKTMSSRWRATWRRHRVAGVLISAHRRLTPPSLRIMGTRSGAQGYETHSRMGAARDRGRAALPGRALFAQTL